ncbi:MAG: hypothetical protein U1G05_04595, partial [Kiritimatiellia bacterium]
MFRLVPVPKTPASRTLVIRTGRQALCPPGENDREAAEILDDGRTLTLVTLDAAVPVLVNGQPAHRANL